MEIILFFELTILFVICYIVSRPSWIEGLYHATLTQFLNVNHIILKTPVSHL